MEIMHEYLYGIGIMAMLLLWALLSFLYSLWFIRKNKALKAGLFQFTVTGAVFTPVIYIITIVVLNKLFGSFLQSIAETAPVISTAVMAVIVLLIPLLPVWWVARMFEKKERKSPLPPVT